MTRMLRVVLALSICASACGPDTLDSGPDAAGPLDTPPAPAITADALRAAIATCDVIGGKYAKDAGGIATVDICGGPGIVFWTADLDVDCDGKETPQCNLQTDRAYQDETAASDSMGDPLDAAALPYVVFPGASTRFTYANHEIGMRTVVAVVYRDKVAYGVAGDVGPASAIGEASYAMAVELGIDPDPSTGGTAEPVSYIAFTGVAARVSPIEDHVAAVALGTASATVLLGL